MVKLVAAVLVITSTPAKKHGQTHTHKHKDTHTHAHNMDAYGQQPTENPCSVDVFIPNPRDLTGQGKHVGQEAFPPCSAISDFEGIDS